MLQQLVANSTPTDRSLPATAIAGIVLLSIMGLAALPSGWGLMHPADDGTALGMSTEWLSGSPFRTYFVPGLILFGLFGLGALASAAMGLLRLWPAPYLAFIIGVGLVIWIVVQLAIIRRYFFLQPVMLVWGLALAVLAYLWWRQWWHVA